MVGRLRGSPASNGMVEQEQNGVSATECGTGGVAGGPAPQRQQRMDSILGHSGPRQTDEQADHQEQRDQLGCWAHEPAAVIRKRTPRMIR